VKPFIPPIFGGHILLTTRAQATGRLARRIQVEVMPLEVGTLFLLRRATLIASDASLEQASPADCETALQIVRDLEGLPLALDQAGAYIEGTRCSLSWYLKTLQSQRMALLKRRDESDIDHPASVATTWLISFEHIQQMNLAAAELLYLCAFLSPDSIPEEIAMQGISFFAEQFGEIVADPLLFNDLLEILHTASLVKRDAANRTLSIHRLVQAVLKDTMTPQLYQQWAERAVRAVNEVFPRAEFRAWPLYERCITNALVCATLIEQEHLLFPEAGNLLNNAGRYLLEMSQYKESERLLKQAVALREKCLGPEHPDTATSLNNLGSLAFFQGKYLKAEQFQRKALTIREKSLGADHPTTGISVNNVEWMCYVLGKYTEAEQLYKQALAIYQQHQRTDHPGTITTTTNLAWLYYRQSRYVESEQLYLQALAAQERRAESPHPNMGRILNNLALLYTEWARYAEAS
jgi:tetratricopeptide (TPR) repeat protein